MVGGVGFPPAWRQATRSATPTSATTTWLPPGYDSNGGSPTTPRASARCWASSARRLALEPPRFERALEIGAGTGYFIINLVRAGVVGEAVATDISPGMLEVLSATAADLGVTVETAACEASALPFEDSSSTWWWGHAVLHHLPGPGRRVPRVPARAAPRRRGGVLRRAVPTTGIAWPSCPSAASTPSRRCGAR